MTEKTAEKVVDVASFIVTKCTDVVAMYAVTFGSAMIIKSGYDGAGQNIGEGKAKLLGGACAVGGLGTAMYVDKKISPIIRNKIKQFVYMYVGD